VITGAADHPVYLYINGRQVELPDASPYWGKDVYTVTDHMSRDLDQHASGAGQVLAIGPAGENLVRFANLIHKKGHAAGRTGMGAVWGAKKLKAIYVTGKGKIQIAHPEKLKALRKELKEIYEQSIYISSIQSAGTAAHMDVGIIGGDIPIKNWQMTDWDEIDELGPAAIDEKIHAGNRTCFGCGVACKKDAEVKNGPFKMNKGPGPEYETVATFGTMCLNPDIESVAKANQICNQYGMDTISCGSTIAFAINCYENGLITQKDTDGLELTWGNAAAIVAMVDKIGRKEGVGAVLAEGSARAAAQRGHGHRPPRTVSKTRPDQPFWRQSQR
jgi:aldehyde:ferredoxin oxidoreductase